MANNILFYISGHGFGHSTRQMEVIRQIFQRKAEETRVIVKTTAPEEFFCAGDSKVEYINCNTDVGVVQKDSMSSDLPSTIKSLEEFWNNKETWIKEEEAFALKNDIGVIVSDISPLAFDVSKSLGITSIGISNFSWDWIYSSYTDNESGFLPYISKIKESYKKCDILCRLPFHGDLSVFNKVWEIPCIARKSPFSKKQIKKQLAIEETGKKLVLFSFGGFGLDSLSIENLFSMEDYSFITTGQKNFQEKNVTCFSNECLQKKGVSFQDIVRGVDVVVSKLGYGIVSECIANETPLLAASRKDFPESEIFSKQLGSFIPFLTIEKEELVDGKWEEGLEELLEMKGDFRKLPVHGAEVAAQIILKALNGKMDIDEESRFFSRRVAE